MSSGLPPKKRTSCAARRRLALRLRHFTGRATSRCCCWGSVIPNFSIHPMTVVSASGALMRPRIAAGVPLMRETSQLRIWEDFFITGVPDLGGRGAHLIHIAAKKIGDVFGRLARSQAVSQVLEIEFRPGLAGIDVRGVGRRLFTQIRHVK
jgi:hypothetical protein